MIATSVPSEPATKRARSNGASRRPGGRAGSRPTGASGAGSRSRSRRGARARSPAARGRSRPPAWRPGRGARTPPRRPARSAPASRRRGRPRARGRGRSSCRRRSSGCRTSCCRSCRRSWPGWTSRCPARSRGRGGCAARLRSSWTTPGSTRTRSASGSRSRIAPCGATCRARSPCPIVWPARLVPAPRVTTGSSKRAAATIAAATSSASRGNATTSGSRAYMLASVANRWRVYASSRTSPRSSRRRCAATSAARAPRGILQCVVAHCDGQPGSAPVSTYPEVGRRHSSIGYHPFGDLPQRTPLPADPGADERARPRPARDRRADDRPPRAGLRAARPRAARRPAARSSRPRGPVVVYPSSGTGAWEAALVNTLSPGDRVLAFETGHFATLWRAMAERLGLEVDWVPGDWRHGVDPERAEAVLRADHGIRAVMVVHNETSTGVTSRVAEIRAAIDAAGSDALLLVDTISSLGSIDYRHDEWGVDVTVGCSQKGLMLPAGLGFNAVSEKALAASAGARLPRSYWDWEPILEANRDGLLAVHVRHEPALRPARGARDAARGGAAGGVRAPSPARGGDPARRRGVGPRGALRRPARALGRADGGARARGPRRRRRAPRDPRALRHVARRRARKAAGTGVPDRPSRRLQRPDAGRHAVRRRDGPAAGGRPVERGGVDAAIEALEAVPVA